MAVFFEIVLKTTEFWGFEEMEWNIVLFDWNFKAVPKSDFRQLLTET